VQRSFACVTCVLSLADGVVPAAWSVGLAVWAHPAMKSVRMAIEMRCIFFIGES